MCCLPCVYKVYMLRFKNAQDITPIKPPLIAWEISRNFWALAQRLDKMVGTVLRSGVSIIRPNISD